MAFSPANYLSDDVKAVMRLYDRGIERLINNGLMQQILNHYQIAEWRQE